MAIVGSVDADAADRLRVVAEDLGVPDRGANSAEVVADRIEVNPCVGRVQHCPASCSVGKIPTTANRGQPRRTILNTYGDVDSPSNAP